MKPVTAKFAFADQIVLAVPTVITIAKKKGAARPFPFLNPGYSNCIQMTGVILQKATCISQ